MAVATVDGLAKAAVQIGRTIHRGDDHLAMKDFDGLVDRLGKFLNYVVLAEQLVDGRDPDAGMNVRHFRQRLYESLDRVERSLQEGQIARLGVELARGLATALLEYRGVADDIERVLFEQARRHQTLPMAA